MLIEELLAWIDDVVDELGSRAEVEYAYAILRQGASADRQLAVYRRTRTFGLWSTRWWRRRARDRHR